MRGGQEPARIVIGVGVGPGGRTRAVDLQDDVFPQRKRLVNYGAFASHVNAVLNLAEHCPLVSVDGLLLDLLAQAAALDEVPSGTLPVIIRNDALHAISDPKVVGIPSHVFQGGDLARTSCNRVGAARLGTHLGRAVKARSEEPRAGEVAGVQTCALPIRKWLVSPPTFSRVVILLGLPVTV